MSRSGSGRRMAKMAASPRCCTAWNQASCCARLTGRYGALCSTSPRWFTQRYMASASDGAPRRHVEGHGGDGPPVAPFQTDRLPLDLLDDLRLGAGDGRVVVQPQVVARGQDLLEGLVGASFLQGVVGRADLEEVGGAD